MEPRIERQGVDRVLVSVIVLSVSFWSLVVGELFCRYYLGLGTPPLSVPHPTIEYLFAPDQDLMRFGNRIVYNHWSMRNEQISWFRFTNQSRTMVVGDSVVNGGSLSDHSRLATTILTNDNALYMNVSAGGWGPANELAYLKTFGFFDAKTLIIVLSGHDEGDLPTFAPLDPRTTPQKYPWAIEEAFLRYLPRYLPWGKTKTKILTTTPKRGRIDLSPLIAMIKLAKHEGIAVCVVLHHTRSDRKAGVEHKGLVAMRLIAEEEQTRVVDDREYLDPATSYRDDIHINDKGQAELADAFMACRA